MSGGGGGGGGGVGSMRGGGGGGGGVSSVNGKGSGGISAIPAASRKMVQSLREVVNCSEQEIYAMLKECNMDPNDAVHRLLSLDPFHEVKSKKDKRKESKDTTESRSRSVNSTSTRGSRGGTDRFAGRSSSNQFSSTDSGTSHGKSAYKKENGTNAYTTYPAVGVAGNSMNWRPPTTSETVATEKILTIGTSDGITSSSQPSSGFQSAWLGVPGHVSMADIVKKGRPHGKASATPNTSYPNDLHSYDHASKVLDMNPEPGIAAKQNVPPNDEWPLVEQLPSASVSSLLEPSADSQPFTDQSNLPLDSNQHINPQLDEVQDEDDSSDENLNEDHVISASVSSRKIQEDNSGGASLFDNDLYENMGSYQPHRHAFEHHEAEDVGVPVSSVATNMQELTLQEDPRPKPEEDDHSVIIPNHLQVQHADFSHLSFGSFRSGISSSFSGPFASRSVKNSLEDASTVADTPVGHSETRNPDYYEDEHLRTTSDGNMAHRTAAIAGSYDSPSASQPEALKQEASEAAQGNQYNFPSSASGYTFETSQQLNPAFPHSQTSSQMQNLAPFSSVMVMTNYKLPLFQFRLAFLYPPPPCSHSCRWLFYPSAILSVLLDDTSKAYCGPDALFYVLLFQVAGATFTKLYLAYTNSLPSNLLASTVPPARESDLPYSPFPITQSMSTKYSNAVSSISGSTISVTEGILPFLIDGWHVCYNKIRVSEQYGYKCCDNLGD
ncbi:GBF-interacting protein 1 [Vitis vinifera]|uniref:GBF-interacting protein 1 n=1 Tax=Vitis vinifera TaxID=29760 RepID=A0A438EHZ0_VITVI|nr:GBF-interacting protein 1 [Vitis vinifera]